MRMSIFSVFCPILLQFCPTAKERNLNLKSNFTRKFTRDITREFTRKLECQEKFWVSNLNTTVQLILVNNLEILLIALRRPNQ